MHAIVAWERRLDGLNDRPQFCRVMEQRSIHARARCRIYRRRGSEHGRLVVGCHGDDLAGGGVYSRGHNQCMLKAIPRLEYIWVIASDGDVEKHLVPCPGTSWFAGQVGNAR